MDVDKAVELLKKVIYKPDWKIEVERRWDKWGDVQIILSFKTIDPVTGEHAPIMARHMIACNEIEYHKDDSHVLNVLWRLIMEAERHESMEWFRLEGKQVYPTH